MEGVDKIATRVTPESLQFMAMMEMKNKIKAAKEKFPSVKLFEFLEGMSNEDILAFDHVLNMTDQVVDLLGDVEENGNTDTAIALFEELSSTAEEEKRNYASAMLETLKMLAN